MESSSTHQAPNNSGNNNNENKGVSSFVCRQSSSRWTPTSEQIRILKDLYYNNGIRSPSADQIQRISARLRQYGKIEGKNVFYWFQNHKARERQKKRFTNVTTSTNAAAAAQYDHLHISGSFQRPNHCINTNNNNVNALNPAHWRSSYYLQAHDHHTTNSFNHLYTNNYTPPPPPPNAGVFAAVGHVGSFGYGSVAMEQSFRECSISPKNHKNSGGSIGQDISLPRVYPFLGKKSWVDDEHETLEDDQDDDDNHNNEYDYEAYREIETLPLFPMREEYSSSFTCNNHMINKPESSNAHYYATNAWYQSDINASARASLELTLNSYITTTTTTTGSIDHHFY